MSFETCIDALKANDLTGVKNIVLIHLSPQNSNAKLFKNKVVETKKAYRSKKATEISNTIVKIAKEQFLFAKAQNTLLDSIAKDEAYFVDWLDRLNAAATHQVDALRSILSYEREQLRITKKRKHCP